MNPLKIVTTALAELMLFGLAFGQTTSATSPAVDSTVMQQLTGTISDGICKGHHNRKAATPFGCSLKCVREGARYVLVVGDTVYALEGRGSDLEKFAGGEATITGHLNGSSISVDSVSKAQKAIKSPDRTDS
jgi:hypothetical protein